LPEYAKFLDRHGELNFRRADLSKLVENEETLKLYVAEDCDFDLPRIHDFLGIQAVSLTNQSRTSMLMSRFMKRAFDLVVAAILLLLLAPVAALTAALVWALLGRPVLFSTAPAGSP